MKRLLSYGFALFSVAFGQTAFGQTSTVKMSVTTIPPPTIAKAPEPMPPPLPRSRIMTFATDEGLLLAGIKLPEGRTLEDALETLTIESHLVPVVTQSNGFTRVRFAAPVHGQPVMFQRVAFEKESAVKLVAPILTLIDIVSRTNCILYWTCESINASSFQVQRKFSGNDDGWEDLQRVAANQLELVDDDTGMAGLYTYRVRAIGRIGNASAKSKWSDELDFPRADVARVALLPRSVRQAKASQPALLPDEIIIPDGVVKLSNIVETIRQAPPDKRKKALEALR